MISLEDFLSFSLCKEDKKSNESSLPIFKCDSNLSMDKDLHSSSSNSNNSISLMSERSYSPCNRSVDGSTVLLHKELKQSTNRLEEKIESAIKNVLDDESTKCTTVFSSDSNLVNDDNDDEIRSPDYYFDEESLDDFFKYCGVVKVDSDNEEVDDTEEYEFDEDDATSQYSDVADDGSEYDETTCDGSTVVGRRVKHATLYPGRLNDFQVKEKAHECGSFTLPCTGRLCPNGHRCYEVVAVRDVKALRDKLWGETTIDAPASKERGRRIREMVRSSYVKSSSKFVFSIPVADKKNEVIVCEGFYLACLGIKATYQWKSAKLEALGKFTMSKVVLKRSKPKTHHSAAFIRNFAERNCDPLPVVQGNIEEGEEVRCVPFETVRSFYSEYVAECDKEEVPSSERAGFSTFNTVFNDLRKNIRLMRAKGNFSCCEICLNAAQLLQDPTRLNNPSAREVVKLYRSCHLKQQLRERMDLERRIKLAQQCDPITGQPESFLILPDGMTASRADTPKMHQGDRSTAKEKGRDKFESRVIGCYVVCGSIKGMFLYTTNNLYSSGANTMIQVVRQCMLDLQDMLNNDGYKLPANAYFQFDNCGENKNKYMFAYFSLLIEQNLFERVQINFLIVGHTHCIVDQYFSTLSQKIKECCFIGTPMSMTNLFTRKTQGSSYKPPLLQKLIEVIYDFTTIYDTYINNKIKYYQGPHEFIFYKLHNRCISQYKMYSSDSQYLPTPPQESPNGDNEVNGTIVQPFAPVGDLSKFLKSINIHKSDAVRVDATGVSFCQLTNVPLAIPSTLQQLAEMELYSFGQQAERLDTQSNPFSEKAFGSSVNKKLNMDDREHYNDLVSKQKELRNLCNQSSGYLIWLDAKPNLPDYRDILVQPYDPNKFKDKAKVMHSVAVKVLEDVNSERILISSEDLDVFSYKTPMLTRSELKFLQHLRDNPLGALDALTNAFQNSRIEENRWISFDRKNPVYSEVVEARIESNRQLMVDAHVNCLVTLEKSRFHGVVPGYESIAREGLLDPKQVAEDLSSVNMDETQKLIREKVNLIHEKKKAAAKVVAEAKKKEKARLLSIENNIASTLITTPTVEIGDNINSQTDVSNDNNFNDATESTPCTVLTKRSKNSLYTKSVNIQKLNKAPKLDQVHSTISPMTVSSSINTASLTTKSPTSTLQAPQPSLSSMTVSSSKSASTKSPPPTVQAPQPSLSSMTVSSSINTASPTTKSPTSTVQAPQPSLSSMTVSSSKSASTKSLTSTLQAPQPSLSSMTVSSSINTASPITKSLTSTVQASQPSLSSMTVSSSINTASPTTKSPTTIVQAPQPSLSSMTVSSSINTASPIIKSLPPTVQAPQPSLSSMTVSSSINTASPTTKSLTSTLQAPQPSLSSMTVSSSINTASPTTKSPTSTLQAPQPSLSSMTVSSSKSASTKSPTSTVQAPQPSLSSMTVSSSINTASPITKSLTSTVQASQPSLSSMTVSSSKSTSTKSPTSTVQASQPSLSSMTVSSSINTASHITKSPTTIVQAPQPSLSSMTVSSSINTASPIIKSLPPTVQAPQPSLSSMTVSSSINTASPTTKSPPPTVQAPQPSLSSMTVSSSINTASPTTKSPTSTLQAPQPSLSSMTVSSSINTASPITKSPTTIVQAPQPSLSVFLHHDDSQNHLSLRKHKLLRKPCECGHCCGLVSDDFRKCESCRVSDIASNCYYLKCSHCKQVKKSKATESLPNTTLNSTALVALRQTRRNSSPSEMPCECGKLCGQIGGSFRKCMTCSTSILFKCKWLKCKQCEENKNK